MRVIGGISTLSYKLADTKGNSMRVMNPSPERTDFTIIINPDHLLKDGDLRPRVREYCEDRGHEFVDYEFRGREIVAYVAKDTAGKEV